jgi:hypothetical protein
MRYLRRYIAHLLRTPSAAMAVAAQAGLQDRTCQKHLGDLILLSPNSPLYQCSEQ